MTVTIIARNSAPTRVKATASAPDATGAVSITTTARDFDRDTLIYTAPASTAKGLIADNGAGRFTYTPTLAARSAAAAPGAPTSAKTDTVTITVVDGHGGTTTTTITVKIAPLAAIPNRSPNADNYTAGQPNPITGTVTGKVTATDPDNDPLTYTSPTTTAKGGAVTLTNDGTFTYAPTAEARAAAAAPNAPAADRQDTFTVTISDAHGGTATIAVQVAISPAIANRPPQIGNPPYDYTIDQQSGVVSGTVNVTEPDGDQLTYGLETPIDPKLGTVSVEASTGNWIYTPTRKARESAFYATGPDTVTFAVIASDGHAETMITVVAPITVLAPSSPNQPPIVAETAFTVDSIDPSTGAISGRLNVTDPDDDFLTFAVAELSSAGSLSIDTATGHWTYVPSAQQLLNAWTQTKPYSAEFSMTITDGLHNASVRVTADALASLAAVTASLETRGSRPNGVAVGADGLIYVINDGAGTLSIVEPDGRVARTVRVGGSPSDIGIDQNGRVWITDAENGSVSVFNADATLLRTLEVGSVPTSIAISGDRAVVTNFGSDSVSFIDLADYAVQTITDVGASPIDSAVGQDGVVYIANFGDSTITLVGRNGQILRTVSSGGHNPSGITVDDAGTIYVTHPLDNTVTVIRAQITRASLMRQAATAAPDLNYTNIKILGAPTRITRDGTGRIYVATSSGTTIAVINPATLAASTIGVGAEANSVYADNQGNIYVTNGAMNTVSVINAKTNTVIHHNVSVRTGTVNIDSNGNLVLINNYEGAMIRTCG